jgi:hypothetical protein
MKTFRIFGKVLVTIVMCVNFTSCSKEGEPQYKLVTGEKKIAKLEIYDNNYGDTSLKFTYDNSGKLLEIIYNHNEDETRTYNYTWSNNAIKVDYQSYALNAGLIRNWANIKDVKYQDGELHEIEYLSSYSDDFAFSWGNNGELTSRGIYYKEEKSKRITELFRFIYDETATCCSGFNPITAYYISCGFDGDHLCVAHPELLGGRTTMLPTHFLRQDYWLDHNGRPASETITGTCTYKFDSDGYVTECNICEDNPDEYSYKAKYIITWE